MGAMSKSSMVGLSARGMSSMVSVKGPGGRSSISGVQAAVFGASGFLGNYVVNALGRGGSQLICAHRSEPDGARHLKVMGDLGQIHILPYHLQDEESIRQVTEGCNVVVNLVGAPWETRNFNFDQVHVEGAAAIARAAADAGATRLIHVSHLAQGTCEESGFATSKAAGEQAVKEAFPDVTIVRPATMWGEGDRFLSNIGTGLRGGVMICLPELNKDPAFLEKVCDKFDLQPRGSAGEHSAAVGAKWDISNKQRIGFSEVQLVQKMIDGVTSVIAIEEQLAGGAKIEDIAL